MVGRPVGNTAEAQAPLGEGRWLLRIDTSGPARRTTSVSSTAPIQTGGIRRIVAHVGYRAAGAKGSASPNL
jgi:hypothetical protein